MSFHGFPPEAVTFYEQLEADNTKAFWTAHRSTYEAAVKGPMLALTEELHDEFGPFHVFRPHRDVRFSRDRTPYKTHTGAVSEREGGALYYVQISAHGLMAASGYYDMASDQLARFREAVADEQRGSAVEAIAASLERAGYELGAISEVKTAPRGFPKDHPRIVLLRRKGLIASRRWPATAWLHTKKAKTKVVETWRGCDELNDWLDAHVGPSTLPPDDGRR
jgi:uncharacterized protein (TIGR02453 family)